MIYTTLLKSAFRAVHGPTPDFPPESERSGIILVADGIGGLDLCGTGLIHVAAKSRLPHHVQLVSWGHGFGHWHRDLTDVENHELQAANIVREVQEFRERKPLAPIFLVGKSGGTGVVVKALESLPERSVESTVLLSSALSPTYNLSLALQAVRSHIISFWSPLDVFILGAGTRIFGTIDRKRAVSAGLVGFQVPDGLDETARSLYQKLHQIRWSPTMASTGYLGGHVGPDNPAFLRKYVLPLLRVEECTGRTSRRESKSTSRMDVPSAQS